MKHKTIRTTVQRHGFEGILYRGNGSKDKAMIVMSGSNGGMTLTAKEAVFYHNSGIPALALALFGTKQTKKDLDRVPAEYVERAVRWLKKRGYKKVGIDGASKGSEMALLAASLIPDISCVIARVPSFFISEGLSGNGKNKGPSGTSCWSWRGKELPYAPYRSRKFNIIRMLMKEKELHIISFNRGKKVTPETVIPIQRIKAPILFISSKHDEVWDSYKSSVIMERMLDKASFPYPHKHIAYDYLSHAMLTEMPLIYKFAFKTERQNPGKCAEEREMLKTELIDWVEKTL
ncbi:MAG: hypothetical protein J6X60_08895 [Ruminiclostridium sp.]|nr:hypothetical protein [Ruminiclostridium sp.]